MLKDNEKVILHCMRSCAAPSAVRHVFTYWCSVALNSQRGKFLYIASAHNHELREERKHGQKKVSGRMEDLFVE